jgi:hypothetical protein
MKRWWSAKWWQRVYCKRGDMVLRARAVLWLFVAWLALDALPGMLYRHMLRPRTGRRRLSLAESRVYLRMVRRAVTAMARRVPWRAVCFHQGIAAQRLLSRKGIHAELHYGVASSDKRLGAHVWVEALGETVVGGEVNEQYTLLAVFAGQTGQREPAVDEQGARSGSSQNFIRTRNDS